MQGTLDLASDSHGLTAKGRAKDIRPKVFDLVPNFSRKTIFGQFGTIPNLPILSSWICDRFPGSESKNKISASGSFLTTRLAAIIAK
jgi:hypothetical protein